MAADYEGVVALAQGAPRIKVVHQGWRPPIQASAKSAHTWTLAETHRGDFATKIEGPTTEGESLRAEPVAGDGTPDSSGVHAKQKVKAATPDLWFAPGNDYRGVRADCGGIGFAAGAILSGTRIKVRIAASNVRKKPGTPT